MLGRMRGFNRDLPEALGVVCRNVHSKVDCVVAGRCLAGGDELVISPGRVLNGEVRSFCSPESGKIDGESSVVGGDPEEEGAGEAHEMKRGRLVDRDGDGGREEFERVADRVDVEEVEAGGSWEEADGGCLVGCEFPGGDDGLAWTRDGVAEAIDDLWAPDGDVPEGDVNGLACVSVEEEGVLTAEAELVAGEAVGADGLVAEWGEVGLGEGEGVGVFVLDGWWCPVAEGGGVAGVVEGVLGFGGGAAEVGEVVEGGLGVVVVVGGSGEGVGGGVVVGEVVVAGEVVVGLGEALGAEDPVAVGFLHEAVEVVGEAAGVVDGEA